MNKDTSTYLAICLGGKDSPKMASWNALPQKEQEAKMKEGVTLWKAWVEKHQAAIVHIGGPLGNTKKISEHGIKDVSNALDGFTMIRAASHEEAAKMFENHPHFSYFPGESIEVMPVLSIPGDN